MAGIEEGDASTGSAAYLRALYLSNAGARRRTRVPKGTAVGLTEARIDLPGTGKRFATPPQSGSHSSPVEERRP